MKSANLVFDIAWNLLALYGLMNLVSPVPRSDFGAMAIMTASVGGLAWLGMRYRAARVARIARLRGAVWRGVGAR